MPVVALCGSLAVYALGMVAFRMRNTGTVARARIVTAAPVLGAGAGRDGGAGW